MEQERRDDQLAVADLVDDDAADDDAEAEPGETGAADGAELRAVNPNSAAQLARMPPRMPKPMPAARIARNPAHSRRMAFGAIAPALTVPLLMGFLSLLV